MPLHEVLALPKVLSGELWLRPVRWKGYRQAFVLKNGQVYAVPGPRGGSLGITSYVEELAGAWEAVSADTVLEEAA